MATEIVETKQLSQQFQLTNELDHMSQILQKMLVICDTIKTVFVNSEEKTGVQQAGRDAQEMTYQAFKLNKNVTKQSSKWHDQLQKELTRELSVDSKIILQRPEKSYRTEFKFKSIKMEVKVGDQRSVRVKQLATFQALWSQNKGKMAENFKGHKQLQKDLTEGEKMDSILFQPEKRRNLLVDNKGTGQFKKGKTELSVNLEAAEIHYNERKRRDSRMEKMSILMKKELRDNG